MNPWILLFIAIVSEVIATASLRSSAGLTKLVPTIVVLVGYGISFYLMAQVLKMNFSISVAYAVWSGVGTAAIAIIGFGLWREPVTLPKLGGILLIIVGVILLNLVGNPQHS
jgi:small multidrug resistance pump